jgi:hypothetical protein
MTAANRPMNDGLRRAYNRMVVARALASAVTLRTVCLSCGQTIQATIGGGAPADAILVAGACIPIPGQSRYRHSPEVWRGGERIR